MAELSNVIDLSISYKNDLSIIDADEHLITLGFDVEIEAEFGARFSFSMHGSPMGGLSETKVEHFILYIIVTIRRDIENNPEPVGIEVNEVRLTVDFGDVEPDWDRYYY